MKFGALDLAEAEGAILAHGLAAGALMLRKGTRLSAADVAALRAAGVATVVAARLEPGDVGEDIAAGRLAAAIAADGLHAAGPFTGRANLHSVAAGILMADKAAVDAFNRIDPAITLATLPAFAPVAAGELVATVKIIPYAVSAARLEAAERAIRARPPLRLAPFRLKRIGLVATTLPSLKPSTMTSTRQRFEARLAAMGATLLAEIRVPHAAEPVADALRTLRDQGAELIVIFGASAVVDAADLVPAGIAAAGGQIERVGMPVDPGNLLVLGDLAGVPVIGAPGCARSPKENGFDFVLRRLVAGLAVTSDDIAALGVGGLLKEIGTRPQPRERSKRQGAVAALILAAGQGRRMGGPNKLLAEIDGRSLVRHVAEAACASRAHPAVVVTGHAAPAVETALSGLAVAFLHNSDHPAGLSTSIRRGVAALPDDAAGALILLADMPYITAAMLDRLIAAFEAAEGRPIVVPTHQGWRGNPVLWPRRFFGALGGLAGDVGARHLIGEHADEVLEVEIGEAAAIDLDTPEALALARGRLLQSEAPGEQESRQID